MKLITVSGPPSSGKTSVILNVIKELKNEGIKAGVVKMDCLATHDNVLYERNEIPVKVGLSGNLCPDHFFVSNIEDCVSWGIKSGFDVLVSESAGLCNRCSPHIKEVMAVCVIDNLMGVNTPKKIGPEDGAAAIPSYVAVKENALDSLVMFIKDCLFNDTIQEAFSRMGRIIPAKPGIAVPENAHRNNYKILYPDWEWIGRFNMDLFNEICRNVNRHEAGKIRVDI